MTNTDTRCPTCGHDRHDGQYCHTNRAGARRTPNGGVLLNYVACGCFVPAPSTESEVLQKIRAGVPGYAPAPSTTPLCNCYTSGEGTIQCKMPNGVGCPYAALRNMPSTTDVRPSPDEIDDALAVIAEGWGEGGCEGWAAAIAVWALGWCGKCGKQNELTPAHNIMLEMKPYGHAFMPAEDTRPAKE